MKNSFVRHQIICYIYPTGCLSNPITSFTEATIFISIVLNADHWTISGSIAIFWNASKLGESKTSYNVCSVRANHAPSRVMLYFFNNESSWLSRFTWICRVFSLNIQQLSGECREINRNVGIQNISPATPSSVSIFKVLGELRLNKDYYHTIL